MDKEAIKKSIVTNVYQITKESNVALHRHVKADEIFYCIAGEGYGVLEDREIRLTVGKEFIVLAGVMHSLKTDGELWVTSFLIPLLK